jgi:predicted nucleic acid-binding protein
MRHSVFLDTNIILDIVLNRNEFVADARKILELYDEDGLDLYTSALSIANVAYVVKKLGKNHIEVVRQLLTWFSLIDLTRNHFEYSVASRFKDFEDGLQYFAAREIKGLDYIITRDTYGFRESGIPVVTPKEFLQAIRS